MEDEKDGFTLELVKEHLRLLNSDGEEEALIESYMEAAKDFAETFLGRELKEFEDLPGTVLAGLLLHVGLMYEDREGGFTEKNLKPVKLLYYPYRNVPV